MLLFNYITDYGPLNLLICLLVSVKEEVNQDIKNEANQPKGYKDKLYYL